MSIAPVRVTLVRHAHAEWPDYQGKDFDRPLTERGIAEAEATALAIARSAVPPERIIASPAVRTRQTAEILARELLLPGDRLQLIPALYNANRSTLERELLQHATGRPLLMLGHNPGISDLARHLSAEPLRAYFRTAEWQTVELVAG